MIRKLASGEYRLYSRKKIRRPASAGTWVPSTPALRPRSTSGQSSTSNATTSRRGHSLGPLCGRGLRSFLVAGIKIVLLLMRERFDIAADLRKIARLLEIKGENPFKTQAYERGASAIENHQGDFDALVKTAPQGNPRHRYGPRGDYRGDH